MEASGHLTIEQVPPPTGTSETSTPLTGAVNGWAITKSSDKPDPSEIYQLRAEVFALREKLAAYENGIENIKENYVTEKMSHGSSSSNYVTKKMSPSLATTTTTGKTENLSKKPAFWEILGKGGKGVFRLNWRKTCWDAPNLGKGWKGRGSPPPQLFHEGGTVC